MFVSSGPPKKVIKREVLQPLYRWRPLERLPRGVVKSFDLGQLMEMVLEASGQVSTSMSTTLLMPASLVSVMTRWHPS